MYSSAAQAVSKTSYRRTCGRGTQTLTFEAKAKDSNPGAELFVGLDRAAAGCLSVGLEAGWKLGT